MPTRNLFKFIIPADYERLAHLQSRSNTQEGLVVSRTSSKGKLVSIAAKELMLSANKIVERFVAAVELEGVMALGAYLAQPEILPLVLRTNNIFKSYHGL